MSLLDTLARRVRHERTARRWTIRDLAERSGLSARFLVQLESGHGNISVRRLDDVARALKVPAAELLKDDAVRPPRLVALLGLRGAGKTSVGRQLARRLRARFVELDRRIEQTANLSLAEIFSLYGDAHYRRLERDALAQVIDEARPTVLATGGGIVTSPDTYAMLKASAVTVWLRATPDEHWTRVLRQRDRRPMAERPQAMADLRAILAAREPLYAAATLTVNTSDRSVGAVVDELAAKL
jgi:XRE family aerobic/anaerobic benzoate catabolism transcriptional regulator